MAFMAMKNTGETSRRIVQLPSCHQIASRITHSETQHEHTNTHTMFLRLIEKGRKEGREVKTIRCCRRLWLPIRRPSCPHPMRAKGKVRRDETD